ncbi:hypothetical protein UFOVP647_9 [uncultured Caudovirales phage]|uniref:Glycine-rich domain-containing protein n=1 Tax=uncultured Caudovirales phage TaxID=2100421 RepID=A0A6J5N5Z9_9CAUD|nr:hypothetical protein UFOVP647_9 [uncultured Caudovirales phage]
MNSLNQLNTFSATSLDVIDLRGSKVIFNRKSPLDAIDQVLTITTTTTEISPGIEIEEIINYQTANVRFVVTIIPGVVNPLVGSTITWTSLPAGVNLTQGAGVYTISNISTITQWNAIKTFNWNLPANATSYPLWYLTVAVVYYDSKLGTDIDKSWLTYDDRFYYLTDMQTTANLDCLSDRINLASSNLNSNFTLSSVAGKLQYQQASLSSNFSLTATGTLVVANMYMTSTMSTTAKVIRRPSVNLLPAISLSVPNTKIVKNISRARTYISNNENILFTTNVPYIDTTDTTGSYTITFNSSIGTFSPNSTTTPTSPWSYTGTLAEVNSMYSQILFYPTKDYSSTGTITYTHALGGTTEFTRTINLSGTVGTFNTQIITFNASTTWTPSNIQYKYGLLDILLVAGGGGGGLGGGGGGGVRELTNVSLSSTSYSISIGTGGTGMSRPVNQSLPNSFDYTGGTGNNTSAFGYTVNGGLGGRFARASQYANFNFDGGKNGSYTSGPTQNNGGVSTANVNSMFGSTVAGGGGSSMVSSGGTASWTVVSGYDRSTAGVGATGTSSTITGSLNYYGPGGGGGKIDIFASQTVGRGTQPTNYGSGGAGFYGNFGVSANDGKDGVVIIKIHS